MPLLNEGLPKAYAFLTVKLRSGQRDLTRLMQIMALASAS